MMNKRKQQILSRDERAARRDERRERVSIKAKHRPSPATRNVTIDSAARTDPVPLSQPTTADTSKMLPPPWISRPSTHPLAQPTAPQPAVTPSPTVTETPPTVTPIDLSAYRPQPEALEPRPNQNSINYITQPTAPITMTPAELLFRRYRVPPGAQMKVTGRTTMTPNGPVSFFTQRSVNFDI